MRFWVVGGVIGLVGLVVAAWALWGDRARGRKRCGRCWYSMEGVNGLVCPECGRAAKGERGLLRTRRRLWRAVGGVVVMVVGAVVVVMPELQKTSAITWLPRPALVVLVRWTDTDGGAAFEELIKRANVTGVAGAGVGVGAVCVGWSAWEVRWFAEHVGDVVDREVGKAVPPVMELDMMAVMRTGSPAAATAMLKQMRPRRWEALETLALMGRAGSSAIPGVIRACQDQVLARGAMHALASIGVGDDRAVDSAISILNDGTYSLPHEVVAALLRIAISPAQQKRAEEALRLALDSTDAETRFDVVSMLAMNQLPFSYSDELAPGLERLIRAGPERTSELGAMVLIRLPDSVGPVFERIIRGGAASHAPAVLRAVCTRKTWPPPMIDAVRWGVEQGGDARTRWAATNAAICVGRGDERFVELLVRRAAEDDDVTVRSAALWSLHQIAPVEVTRRAAIAALGDEHADMRGAAVGVLEQLGAEDAASREALCAERVEPDEKLAARVRVRCEQWAEAGGK